MILSGSSQEAEEASSDSDESSDDSSSESSDSSDSSDTDSSSSSSVNETYTVTSSDDVSEDEEAEGLKIGQKVALFSEMLKLIGKSYQKKFVRKMRFFETRIFFGSR